MFLLKLFKGVNLKILIVEVLIFVVILLMVGVYTNPTDPLFLKFKYGYLFYMLPLLVFTLYYGFVAGTIFISVLSMLIIFFYHSIDIDYLLWIILFALIASEFNYYWSENVKKSEEKFRYADEKLRDLARELMILKTSHDQLEKQYILNPVSIRKVILDIREILLKSEDETSSLREIFWLIVRIFNIEKAALVKYNYIDDKFNLVVSSTDEFYLNQNNLLVRKAIEDDNISYISQIDEYTEYLAVIPVKVEDVSYLFIIEQINFMYLDMDNLLKINLFLYYLTLEMMSLRNISDLVERFNKFDIDFLKELYRCHQMHRKLGVESSLVLFILKDSDEDVTEKIQNSLRGLDVANVVSGRDRKFLIILLPFTPPSGAMSFIKRITNLILEHSSISFLEKKVRYRVFKVEGDIDRILSSISGEIEL